MTEPSIEHMTTRLSELREKRGWTQAQLSVYAGVSPATVSLIEHGHRNPNAITLQKLANALGVAPGTLFREAKKPREVSVYVDTFCLSNDGHQVRLLLQLSWPDGEPLGPQSTLWLAAGQGSTLVLED